MLDNNRKIKVGISIGDLNGIGSELILKTFENELMLDLCTPVVFANLGLMGFLNRHFKTQLHFHGIADASEAIEGRINIVNVWKDKTEINFGQEDKELGKYTLASLEAAVTALKKEQIDTLLTAPINKNVIQSDKFDFPGHTDYLAKELGGESLMFMISGNLRVGLLTDHVPVNQVVSKITPELIQHKFNLMKKSLLEDFRIPKPKIAVLGINPHCGDNGVIGEEDDKILRPVIQKLNDQGNLIFGPYAADSFFGSSLYQQFDGIIAAYHDQGLTPFKTLSFGNGVNYTAGLNKVRTSPDHGTAYDIAGKGEADPGSFREALYLGLDIFRSREEYKVISANPLPIRRRKRDKD